MNGDAAEDYITNADRIHDLLIKLKRQAVPLKLDIEGLAPSGLSAIIDVAPEDGVLCLDKLPGDLPRDMQINKKISIYGEVDGVSFSFDTRLTTVPMQANIPTRMFYCQRRQDYRVHVGLGNKVTLQLRTNDNTPVEGIVRNLSAGGLRFEIWFDIQPWDNLKHGEVLHNCTLALGSQESLHCSLEIRHIEINKQHGRHSIGAQFVDLKPADKRRIRLYSMMLEREQRRRTLSTDL